MVEVTSHIPDSIKSFLRHSEVKVCQHLGLQLKLKYTLSCPMLL